MNDPMNPKNVAFPRDCGIHKADRERSETAAILQPHNTTKWSYTSPFTRHRAKHACSCQIAGNECQIWLETDVGPLDGARVPCYLRLT
jgi:hypothetical protein